MIDEKIAKELLPKAADIATQVMLMIGKEASDASNNDDFREGIYLLTNIMANLVSQTCLSLAGFSKSYGLNDLNENSYWRTIKNIVDMRLKQNKDYIEHIKGLIDAEKSQIGTASNLCEPSTH